MQRDTRVLFDNFMALHRQGPKSFGGMTAKTSLIGLTQAELKEKLKELGFEPFRAKQIWHWLYAAKARDGFFADDHHRQGPAGAAGRAFCHQPPGHRPRAGLLFDTTRKWLLQFPDGNKLETVFIPEEDRGALCVSSQVGCTLSCTFCHTGTMKLVRNLTAGEIIGQVMVARDGLGEWGKRREDCLFTNIVLMGMGEPLYNYDQVAKALHIIMDMEGIAISKRRITLSNLRRRARDQARGRGTRRQPCHQPARRARRAARRTGAAQ